MSRRLPPSPRAIGEVCECGRIVEESPVFGSMAGCDGTCGYELEWVESKESNQDHLRLSNR